MTFTPHPLSPGANHMSLRKPLPRAGLGPREAVAMRPSIPSPENEPVNASLVGRARIDHVPVREPQLKEPDTFSYCPSWSCVPVQVHEPPELLVDIVTDEPSSVMTNPC